MTTKQITTEDIADAIINLSENIKLCDEETATGLKSSKKKDILKSNKDGSFNKFANECKKRQAKKD